MARVLGSLFLIYEVVAAWSGGRLPTYTRLAWDNRDKGPVVAMIVGAFSAWLYYHLMIEGRGL